MSQQRDPRIEEILRLAWATDFRQPGDGGVAATRSQLLRYVRTDAEWRACERLTSVFRGPKEAAAVRAKANESKAKGARTALDAEKVALEELAARRHAASQARIEAQKREAADIQAQNKSMIESLVEDRAKEARLQQQRSERSELALQIAALRHRSVTVQPVVEKFVSTQREHIAVLQTRRSGDADCGDALINQVAQLCRSVQQEVAQQVYEASRTSTGAGGLAPTLLLIGPDDFGADPSSALNGYDAASAGASRLEEHLHLRRDSPLRKEVERLLQVPPRKLLQAMAQLSQANHASLEAMVGGWDLLGDARRHAVAHGATVDPLYEARMMNERLIAEDLEVRKLGAQLTKAKATLLQLAKQREVAQAMAHPGVKLRVQVAGWRATVAAARAALDELRQEAAAGRAVQGELERLREKAAELNGECMRVKELYELVTNAKRRVAENWQQGYSAQQEFVQRMLPAEYGRLAECARAAHNVLGRSVEALAAVPSELLSHLGDWGLQRRHQQQQAWAQGGGGVAGQLDLVSRVQLALPYVGPARAAAKLRAAATAGNPGSAGSGTVALHSSLTGSGTLPGRGSAAAASGGTGLASLLSSGAGRTGGSWSGPGTAFAGVGSGASDLEASGGGRHAFASSGRHLMAGGVPPPPGVLWSPAAAALGLPPICYWLAAAAAVDPLAALRCPAALVQQLNDRLKRAHHQAQWLADADKELKSRQRALSAMRPVTASLASQLAALRSGEIADMLRRVARGRTELGSVVAESLPRVERELAEFEEVRTARLVPWRKVNGLSCGEYLDEMRNLFAAMRYAQEQAAAQAAREAAPMQLDAPLGLWGQ